MVLKLNVLLQVLSFVRDEKRPYNFIFRENKEIKEKK